MPTKLDAEAALKEARAFLDTPEFDDASHREGGPILYRGSLKHDAVKSWAPPWRGGGALECDDQAVWGLIEKARDGDPDAVAVLRDIAGDMLKGGMQLPSSLANYVAEELKKPASKGSKARLRPGPKPNALKIRNRYIAEAVDRVAKRGFKLFRNTGSRSDDNPSACSIVAEALTRYWPMGEDAVEKIVRGARKTQSKRRKN